MLESLQDGDLLFEPSLLCLVVAVLLEGVNACVCACVRACTCEEVENAENV